MSSMPITWRTITGPSAAEAMRPLEVAGRTMNGAFDKLQDVLKQREDIAAANWANQKTNNTQAFLDAIAQYRTPEALAAAQQAGEINALRQKFGSQIDSAAIRGAEEQRMTALRDQVLKANEFSDKMLAREQQPIRDNILTMLYSGNGKGATELLAANPNLSNRPEIQKTIAEYQRKLIEQGQHDTRFSWDQQSQQWKVAEEAQKEKLRPIAVKQAEASLAHTQINNRLTSAQATKAEQDAKDAGELRILETAIARAAAANSVDKNAIGTTQGKLATTLKFPVNASGHADFSKFTTEQMTAFDEAAKKSGIPTSSAMLQGDTLKADNLYQSLLKEGKISPRLLRANENAIRSAFNSSYSGMNPVGNDAVAAATSNAQNTVAFDRLDSSNWYAPNSADARKSYEELAAKLPEILKGMPNGVWFGDNQKDLPDLQRTLGEIAATGIKRKDGTYVVPSVNDVLRVIRSEEGGFRDDARAKDVKEALKKWVDTPEAIQMHIQGIQSQTFRDNARANQMIRDALFPQKK